MHNSDSGMIPLFAGVGIGIRIRNFTKPWNRDQDFSGSLESESEISGIVRHCYRLMEELTRRKNVGNMYCLFAVLSSFLMEEIVEIASNIVNNMLMSNYCYWQHKTFLFI